MRTPGGYCDFMIFVISSQLFIYVSSAATTVGVPLATTQKAETDVKTKSR